MGVKVKQHIMNDNLIMLNNRETVLIGAERVMVGVDTGETEIKTAKLEDGTTYNYEGKKIVGKAIYDSESQHHHNWILLDLETGKRGWYPGKETSED